MLLILGLSVFFRTVGEGDFHCPNCGGDRRYRQRIARRWFTLFFLPVIPLNRLGEVVECRTCRGRFNPDVLRLPTVERMAATLPAAMRVAAVAVLFAGDPNDLAARARAVDTIHGYGLDGFDDRALDVELTTVPAEAEELLAEAGAQLTVEAREWFLAQLVRIGLADGMLTEAERQTLHEVAARIGMTPAHAVGVIATTEGASRE